MDKIQDLYLEAKKHNHYSLELLIDYLVNERKVLKMTDTKEQLTYFLQDKFAKAINGYLVEYERSKKNE